MNEDSEDPRDPFSKSAPFRLPAWGRLTIRVRDPAMADTVWKEVAAVWDDLEENTNQEFLVSQMEKFQNPAESLELYGSEWGVFKVKEALGDRVTVEFQELPEEEIPKRPLPPRPAHWRKPYVPRHKRKGTT